MSAIDQLMRAANPVPDSATALADDDFEALLLVSQTRSGNMDVREIVTPAEPETPRRKGWLVAATAFAAIVVVVGVAVLLMRPTTDVAPATTPPTTEATVDDAAPMTEDRAFAIADAYVGALEAGDVEAAIGTLAPDAEIFLGSRMVRSDGLEQYLAWGAAQGTVGSGGVCTTVDIVTADTFKIGCTYGYLQGLAAAVGATPVPVELVLYVTPDGIGPVAEGYGQPDFRAVNTPFRAWLEVNHPDDGTTTRFGSWSTIEEAERSGLLRLQYGLEWAAYLKTQGCSYPNLDC
jgi:hypothetical protein